MEAEEEADAAGAGAVSRWEGWRVVQNAVKGQRQWGGVVCAAGARKMLKRHARRAVGTLTLSTAFLLAHKPIFAFGVKKVGR